MRRKMNLVLNDFEELPKEVEQAMKLVKAEELGLVKDQSELGAGLEALRQR